MTSASPKRLSLAVLGPVLVAFVAAGFVLFGLALAGIASVARAEPLPDSPPVRPAPHQLEAMEGTPFGDAVHAGVLVVGNEARADDLGPGSASGSLSKPTPTAPHSLPLDEPESDPAEDQPNLDELENEVATLASPAPIGAHRCASAQGHHPTPVPDSAPLPGIEYPPRR